MAISITDVCKNITHQSSPTRFYRYIFQSPKMVEVLLKLEKEINEGGLTIRHDRKLDADLGK